MARNNLAVSPEELQPIEGTETMSFREFLTTINAPYPEFKEALEQAIASGATDEELSARCDEIGRFKYLAGDPNSLQERLAFDTEKPLDHFNGCYYAEYFRPNPHAIYQVRRLTRLQLEGFMETPPLLETHADYLEYFSQFHPNVLSQLFKNLGALQLNEGCGTACVDICILPAMRSPHAYIPFETLEYIKENHTGDINKHLALYYASDMVDYEYTDEGGNTYNGSDVAALFNDIEDFIPYVSIAYRAHPKAVQFIYDLYTKHQLIIHRISRLASGKKADAIDLLIRKLQSKSLEETGQPFPEFAVNSLKAAFDLGAKDQINTNMGNAVSLEDEDRDISALQVTCFDGVVLTPRGFFAVYRRPPSKLFPHGYITIPIKPDAEGNITLPHCQHNTDYLAPYAQTTCLITEPRFLTLNNNTGEVVEDQEPDSALESVRLISMHKSQLFELSRSILYSAFEKDIKQAIDDLTTLSPEFHNSLQRVTSHVTKLMVALTETLHVRYLLLQRYRNDMEQLTEILTYDSSLEIDLITYCDQLGYMTRQLSGIVKNLMKHLDTQSNIVLTVTVHGAQSILERSLNNFIHIARKMLSESFSVIEPQLDAVRDHYQQIRSHVMALRPEHAVGFMSEHETLQVLDGNSLENALPSE